MVKVSHAGFWFGEWGAVVVCSGWDGLGWADGESFICWVLGR